jgi:CBS domain-containing protein
MDVWQVDDVMTRDVVSVSPGAAYPEIVAKLLDRGVSALPVVDASGRVVGVVSEADLLPRVEVTDGARRPRRKAHAMRAEELMTTPAITIRPGAAIAEAARVLDAMRVKRLPVVDTDGRLLGIVSRRDLLRMYTRRDDEIRADIVDTVLRRDLWINPTTVDVGVEGGVVTLEGEVETRSLAGFAVRLVAAVPGVVRVDDRLRWAQDDSRRVRAPGYAFGTPEELVLPPRQP